MCSGDEDRKEGTEDQLTTEETDWTSFAGFFLLPFVCRLLNLSLRSMLFEREGESRDRAMSRIDKTKLQERQLPADATAASKKKERRGRRKFFFLISLLNRTPPSRSSLSLSLRGVVVVLFSLTGKTATDTNRERERKKEQRRKKERSLKIHSSEKDHACT